MNQNQNEIELQLLAITRKLLIELEAERALQAVTLKASLEHELGIGSLGKTELIYRIEKLFSIRLPEAALIEADSLQDLALVIKQTGATSSFTRDTQQFSPLLTSLSLDLDPMKTLVEIFQTYAATEPQRPHIYLQTEQGSEQIIRYGELFNEAARVANGLIQRGIRPGETVGLMVPTSGAFFYSFCGILLAGAIPVPIYPPFRPDQIETYAIREAKILNNAQARILITFSQAERLSKILQNFIPSLKEVTTLNHLQTSDATSPELLIESNDIALIQYTSGSTGDPKGVTLTHANILANIRAIHQSIPVKTTDVCISWLPLYHDMGLMTWLASLYSGIPVTIMSPLSFLARPEHWLWAIHYHRGSLSGGPNFAYELCVKKIEPQQIEGLDLSSWRFAFNGAEAINPKTLENFSKKFGPYGFKLETFAPVYGLAETTVGLCVPITKRVPRIDIILREPFETKNKAIPTTEETNALKFVGCGEPIVDHEMRVVDDTGKVLTERIVGNLQFRGRSAMQGYYGNPEATAKIYHDGWWETGDLGYMVGNEVFITGRKKDLIIKAGRNIYPQEIEEIVSQISGMRKGCIVAFGIHDHEIGTEKLIIVAETYQHEQTQQQQLRSEIIEKMTDAIGLPPDMIILVPPKTIPKTSSGKLQRAACKQAYLDGKLGKHRLSAKLQIVKLVFTSFTKKIVRGFRVLGKLLYTIYISIIASILFPITAFVILPFSQKISAKLANVCARLYFRLIACPISVDSKLASSSPPQPIIYVANHASYVDSLALLAVLPPGVIFVGKKELLKMPILSIFIRKLEFISVDRMDFTKSRDNVTQIEESIHQRKSIVIFPEGTFTYASGLRPFKLGAFTVSMNTGIAICPVAIQGTRAILRGDTFLAKPGAIHITIGEVIYPQDKNWHEVLRLHTLTRAEIAKYCGEPSIDVVVAGPVNP